MMNETVVQALLEHLRIVVPHASEHERILDFRPADVGMDSIAEAEMYLFLADELKLDSLPQPDTNMPFKAVVAFLEDLITQ